MGVLRYVFLRILRENIPLNKTEALTKSMNIYIWVIGILNQLLIGGSYTQITKKWSIQWRKNILCDRSILCFPFILSLSIGILQGSFIWNVVLLFVVFWAKKQNSSFFKKCFRFSEKLFSKLRYWKRSKSPVIVTLKPAILLNGGLF